MKLSKKFDGAKLLPPEIHITTPTTHTSKISNSISIWAQNNPILHRSWIFCAVQPVRKVSIYVWMNAHIQKRPSERSHKEHRSICYRNETPVWHLNIHIKSVFSALRKYFANFVRVWHTGIRRPDLARRRTPVLPTRFGCLLWFTKRLPLSRFILISCRRPRWQRRRRWRLSRALARKFRHFPPKSELRSCSVVIWAAAVGAVAAATIAAHVCICTTYECHCLTVTPMFRPQLNACRLRRNTQLNADETRQGAEVS